MAGLGAGAQGGASYFPVEKLGESNYMSWSLQMQAFLKKEQCWTAIVNPPVKEEDEEVDEADQRLEDKAYANLILSLEKSQLSHVRDLETASEIWQALRAIHIRDTAGSKITLMRALYRARLSEGECVSTHLQRMRDLFSQLNELGEHFSEQRKVSIVLSSLPESWDNLVMTLEAIPESQLTMHFLTGRLLDEEERRHERKATTPHRNSRNGRQSSKRYATDEERHPKEVVDHREEAAFTVRRWYRCGSTKHLVRQRTVSVGENTRKGRPAFAGKRGDRKSRVQYVSAAV
ncbi:Hypothetical predicted protein [Podarcis lilfordi]|uniref:DUF4219 domain-containing protein n=1 Tax=Podarcis lilfordi TaxID=74358 RepID=A0AA35KU38_9SAUR|nr:Hypothetical predicted protein [Podarcis lilfordi]